MSNWVHLEITLNRDSNVSVKKVVYNVWQDAEVRKESLVRKEQFVHENKRDTFFVSYRNSGMEMLEDIKTILSDIKSWDNKSNPEICITHCVVY